jgi:flagellar hook-associated protein 2
MADFGTLSSLGIGSGVLNYDVIDKLKNADKDLMIKPIEQKLDLAKKREQALSQFITIASTVKTDTLFAKVNTSVNGSSVSVEANDGVKPQEFTVNVEDLATNDMFESKGFASEDTIINSSTEDKQITIGVGDTTTTITIGANATLADLRDAINNADAGVTASIIDTGSDTDPYKLVIKANDTGKDNYIRFDYNSIDDLGLNATTYTSASFTSDTDSVNNSGATQTFKITVNGTDYTMDVLDGETVSDFVNAINNGDLKDANGNSLKITASYDNGVIKLNNLQAIGDISIDDTNLLTDFNDNTDFTNANRLQEASDAHFTYNGVEIERASNKVTDLIPGVTINLNSTGESTVSINNDIDSVVKSIQKFVADYNQMMSNIQSLTAYNQDTGDVGLFQGNTDFRMLERVFSQDLFNTFYTGVGESIDYNGQKYETKVTYSLTDLGFSLNRTGMISFDEDKFRSFYSEHPDVTQNLITSAFSKVKEDFSRYATDDNSVLNILDRQIKDEEKSYQDRIDSLNKFLDARYNTMAMQFAQYDEMINQLNTQSSSLMMVIEQTINSKS